MTQRKRITLLILLILLAIAIIFLAWYGFMKIPGIGSFEKKQVSREAIPKTSEESAEKISLPASFNDEQAIAENRLDQLAKLFVERFGSYSGQSSFSNIEDVFPFMSRAFMKQMEQMIEQSSLPSGYYGITTRVLSIYIESQDEEQGIAKATVSTQREESKGSGQNVSILYQDILLDFVKEDELWKVDSATWQ